MEMQPPTTSPSPATATTTTTAPAATAPATTECGTAPTTARISWAARLAASLPPPTTTPPTEEDAAAVPAFEDVDALPEAWLSQSDAVGLAVALSASYADADADGESWGSSDEGDDDAYDLTLPSASLSRGGRRARTGTGTTAAHGTAATGTTAAATSTTSRSSRRAAKHDTVPVPATAFAAAAAAVTASTSGTEESSGEEASTAGGPKLTTEGVFNRIRHDTDHFMESQWSIGYTDRFLGVMEVPFGDFLRIRDDLVEGIPTHRIVYFLHGPTGTRFTRAAKYRELRAWVAAPPATAAAVAATA